jgi:hypothetical protein
MRAAGCSPITEDHTLGNLTWSPGLLAPALKRHLDGRLDRSADLSLRDLRTCGRYLLRPGGLSPVADDRPHFMYSLCAPHPPTRPPTDRRSRGPGQRVPDDPVPLDKALLAG